MERPNIVLFMTDQQRWDSLGCYGADWVSTPALDSLARDGVRFDRCYCTNPICTPSRASVWTGQHLPGHGVYRLDDVLGEEQVLFPKRLQEAGYRTGLFGKLHVSGRIYENERRHPNDGFDEYEWALEGPLDMDAPMHAYSRWLREQSPEVHERMSRLGRDLLHIPRDLHFTHWANERGRAFIRRHAGRGAGAGSRPFFCCISVFDPHNPYQGFPEEYRDRVNPAKLRPVVEDRRTDIPASVRREREGSYLGDIDTFTDTDIEEMRIGYYASIALADDEFGETLALLKELGIAENTLVIFVSDHGDMLGDHRMLVKGAMFYDPCVRVPLLMRWPVRLAGGTLVSAPVQPHDIAATVLAAAGIGSDVRSDKPAGELVGADLVPLAGKEVESVHKAAYCLYRNTGINRHTRDWDPPIHASMIFDGRYKLSIDHGADAGVEDPPAGELYDMDLDPDELQNLWMDPGASTERLRLTQALTNWLVAAETSYLGSRGGTAHVSPDRYVANTIDRSRGKKHGGS